MAERARVEPGLIRAVIEGDDGGLPEDVRVAVQYTRAVVAHAPESRQAAAEVERRWGRRGLVSLALSVTGSRMYPMLKYALGHGHACQRVHVGGEAIVPSQPGAAVLARQG